MSTNAGRVRSPDDLRAELAALLSDAARGQREAVALADDLKRPKLAREIAAAAARSEWVARLVRDGS